MWSRNTIRESSHISFFCGRKPFVWFRMTTGKHTQESWQIGLSIQRVSLSPKLQTLYCLSSPMWKYEHASLPTYFLFIAGIGTYILPLLFLVICWSYLRTEISGILSTGNKLHSRHPPLFFLFPVKPLCWCYLATGLNLLSSSIALCCQLSLYITAQVTNFKDLEIAKFMHIVRMSRGRSIRNLRI